VGVWLLTCILFSARDGAGEEKTAKATCKHRPLINSMYKCLIKELIMRPFIFYGPNTVFYNIFRFTGRARGKN